MREHPTYALRYLGGGDRKIAAIKLMRELTKLGLAQSKALVEQLQVFAEGLDHATAVGIVDRFAHEAASRVAILDEAEHRYGFDPHHPLRGDQPLVRLRWHGPSLSWERGRIGEWTREREQSFASVDACERVIAVECARWTEQGLETAERELDVVGRTSARELQLEQAIRETEQPDEPMAVHADWLQRQGDPRGLIAALDLARTRAERPDDRQRLIQAFDEALLEHRAHLFGPLHTALDRVRLTWRGGLVIGIEIDWEFLDGEPPDWPLSVFELIEDLLALPICACLRSLRVRSVGSGHPTFANKLMRCDRALLAGLRELELTSHYEFEGFVDWSRLPRLERLELVVGAMTPIALPNLRCLHVKLWRPESALDALRESSLPKLESLTLRFDTEAFHGGWPEVPTAATFAELLALPILASLTTFELRNLGEAWPRWVAQALIDAPSLRHVDVCLYYDEFDGEALPLLLAAQERLPHWSLG